MNDPLVELVERVTKAEGPDRGLDAAIHAAFFPETFDGDAEHYSALAPSLLNRADRAYLAEFVPAYTSSADAALAFAEGIRHRYGRKIICMFHACGQLPAGDMDYDPRARPDNSVTVGWGAHVAFYTDRNLNQSDGGGDRYWYGDTPALAIILATLRALSSQEASK